MTAPVASDRRLKPLPMVAAWFAAQHARDQEIVADNLALGLFPLWQIMRFTELDASTTLWLPAVLPRVETSFLQSQRLSAVFNANVRAAELPAEIPLAFDLPYVEIPLNMSPDSFDLPPGVNIEPTRDPTLPAAEVPAALDTESQRVIEQIARGVQAGTPKWVLDQIQRLDDIRTGRATQPRIDLQKFDRADVAKSLTIQANYMTKRAMPGPEEELMRNALVRSSGAAVRESLNGGRGVTDRVMKKDRKVIGFARVTDSNPCALCALLASRGAVFGKGSFIGTDKKWKLNPEAARDVPDGWTNVAKVHDNCRCMLRPVYANESVWDDGARHYLDLWNNLKPTAQDYEAIRKQYPDMKGYLFERAVNRRAYRRAVDANPFRGNQFDLNQMSADVRDRMNALLDAGIPADSPQIRWHESTLNKFAS